MNSTTTLTANQLTTTQAAVAGGFLGTFMVIALALAVLLAVAWWKIFTKAGEKGWKSIIPFYNLYIMFKICGNKNLFWAVLCATVVAGIMMGANTPAVLSSGAEVTEAAWKSINWNEHIVYIVGMVISGVAAVFANFWLDIKISKAFGKGVGYILGLIFFPNIFTLILGFGKAKYSAKNLK